MKEDNINKPTLDDTGGCAKGCSLHRNSQLTVLTNKSNA